MLTEIEDRLAKILREKLVEIPGENIVVDVKSSKLPAVIISNLKFKFKNAGLAENIDEGKVELEERLNSDGVKTSYKLREKPLKKSVRVESPPGTLLSEKDDYAINYDEGSIDFLKAPEKGKNNVFVRYNSQKSIMTLKSLKVKALYSIDVLCGDRTEADSLAEKVVKALLTVEDQLLGEGIEVKPIGGVTSTEERDKTAKVQLKYIVEREMRVEQVVGPIEKIEITSKTSSSA
jgi:hypothetical protein